MFKSFTSYNVYPRKYFFKNFKTTKINFEQYFIVLTILFKKFTCRILANNFMTLFFTKNKNSRPYSFDLTLNLSTSECHQQQCLADILRALKS